MCENFCMDTYNYNHEQKANIKYGQNLKMEVVFT